MEDLIMYEIKSYQGFGDIKFGDESGVIEKIMKVKPSKFKKSYYDISETDAYEDFFVYYDKDGKCEAIEFNSNADVIFNNILFFGKKYIDVENAFKSIDSNIIIDGVGFNSNKFGIGVYAPNKDDIASEIESVIIFRQGYYD